MMGMTVEERFAAKYEVATSGCWLWTSSRFRNGYGQFRDKRFPTALAHRVSWLLHRGPIPDGMQTDHLCRNPRCVNPDHMELVTNRENSRRGRGSVTSCKHGHAYDDENTGWKLDKTRGWRRYCRACARKGGSARPTRHIDRTHLTRAWPNC